MKNLFFLFFSVFFTLSLSAQTVDFYTTLIDNSKDEYVIDAAEYKLGHFIVAANQNIELTPTAYLSRYSDFGFLLRLDDGGVVTKRAEFPNNRFTDIKSINENKIVVCGVENQNAWVAVVDSNLNVIWQWTKTTSLAVDETFERLNVQHNSIFAIGKSYNANRDTMYITKFDFNGNLLLTQKTTSAIVGGDLRIVNVFEDGSDGSSFWISLDELGTTPFSSIEALKVDENLNFIDTIAFSSNKLPRNIRFYDENHVIYGGAQGNPPDTVYTPLPDPSIWLDLSFGKNHIDSTFRLFPINSGQKYYGKMDSVEIHSEKRCLDLTQKDLIYLGGISKKEISTNRNPFESIASWFSINCLDSVGNLQWQRYFGGDENYYLMSIKATQDGGVLLLGTTFDYTSGVNRRNVHIIKLKNDIQVGSEEVIKNKTDLSIQLYPNPTSDYLQFEIETNHVYSEQFDLKVYNVNGQLLMNRQLRTGLNRYNVGHFPVGTYFYSIVNEDNELVKSGQFLKGE
jgi:hypothetical protein